MRVQCPKCQARMKLTSAIEKVRCPKCETLFKAAENRAQPTASKSRQSSKKKRQPAADPFEFDDQAEDDLFGDSSSRPRSRSSRKTSSNPKARSRRSRKPKAGAIPPEQVRKFGFTMIFLGIGAFILPLIGLQIKGLNKMPPEMQAVGGVCFLILGVVVISTTYIDLSRFGSVAENGFQFVKWGAIGLFALLIGVPLLLVVGRLGFNAVRGGGGGNEVDRTSQEIIQDAEEEHRRVMQQMQQTQQRQQNQMNLANQNSSIPHNRSMQSAPTSSPQATPQANVNPADSASPFQDVTPGNTSTTQPSGRSTVNPNSRSMNGQSNSSSQNRQTVAVILKGFRRSETVRHMRDLRTAAQTHRMRMVKLSDGASRIEFDAVQDAQAFADRISFGKVTNVDTTKHEITLEK